MKNNQYQIIASRQVYIFDLNCNHYLNRSNTKYDFKLLEKTSYKVVEHHEIFPSDYHRIVELYNLLYLEKYSYFNPQFNEKFITIVHQTKSFVMTGLRDDRGILQGIVGTFEMDGIITAPLVGYNTSIPKSIGLYRILITLVLKKTQQQKLLLNLSSGAADFKRLRGGVPSMEFSAVYTKHLSWSSRMAWNILKILCNRIAVPLLKRYEL